LRCEIINKVIVSTDDEEIAKIALDAGAEVPFLRPKELAEDATPDIPVLAHTLDWLSENQKYSPDIILWLRPTAPLRNRSDIESAIELLVESGADSVRSVCHSEHHPFWMKKMEGTKLLPFLPDIEEKKYFRRQLLPPVFRLNGAVEVIRFTSFTRTGTMYGDDIRGYVMPIERSVDIDSEVDIIIADKILKGE